MPRNFSVCKNCRCCSNVSKNVDTFCVKSQRSSKENICTCEEHTACYNAPSESNLITEKCQRHNPRRKTISVCENHLLSYNTSDESNSSTVEEDSKKTSCDSTCVNYSTHYDTTRELGTFVEMLLTRLTRTRAADKSCSHWEMMLHCERAAFPTTITNLPLPSREARFYWHLYSAAAKRSPLYQKNLNHALLVTLSKLTRSRKRKKSISIWDHLISLNTFDRLDRKILINRLKELLRKQTSLESICLEGLSLTPDEGVQLLLALYDSRKTMRYAYCWGMFEKMVSLSMDTEDRIGSRFYADKRIEKCDWLRAIGSLEFLTTLSVNYAYIATPTGDLLVDLAKKLGQHWHWLQLLCLEEDILRKANGQKATRVLIPDEAWRKAHSLAPTLKVQFAIIGIPKYDLHKQFFTKSIRIHTFALSTTIDLKFLQPWYLNCTIKTLHSWYPNSLVYLRLQLWHNRENLDNQLERLFINLPMLQVFEFVGEIRTLKTLCVMCCQIRSGSYNVRRVNLQLQNVIHNNMDKEMWIKSVECLSLCFKRDFERMGVKFHISFYYC